MRKQSSFAEDRNMIDELISKIHLDRSPISLLLDGINDDKNIGLIFRIADGARLKHIYLHNCEFKLNSKNFKKTARSTQNYLEHSTIDLEELKSLKKDHALVAIEKTDDSQDYKTFASTKPLILVLGNEQHGVSQPILKQCEACVHIPMLGINTSLNVAVACGIVVYAYL